MKGIQEITRRTFLGQLIKSLAGTGLYCLMPTGVARLGISELHENIHPYWLEVLSRGFHHVPENIRSFFHGWDDRDMNESVRYALYLTLTRNRHALSGRDLPGEKEMDMTIEDNKASQFLYQHVKESNAAINAGPEVIYGYDVYCAQMFYDLSTFILRNQMDDRKNIWFSRLSEFDIVVLNSNLSYLEEAIRISEHLYILVDEKSSSEIKKNIGSYYNSLALSLSLLGEMREAGKMYLRALEFRPGDTSILENMRDFQSGRWIMRSSSFGFTDSSVV
ncbi:MAG TPA: hypothetical protein PLM29_06815 [Deltaproteobacteria bacterium]|nr:hypothetical protein [Deltaproteobacteria bacterium]